MQYRQLGSTDLSVSAIGMGCVTFGREIDHPVSLKIMDHAFESGITLFDTAEAYGQGSSESLLGEWLQTRQCRDRVVLATKVNGTLTRARILASAESSLKRLQTDYIDLLQTHVWDESTQLEETLEALTLLVQQGKVRYVGCSNYSAEQLARALQLADQNGLARMACVQPPYNLVQRDIEADLLPLCAARQIGVISYSPLAAGFLTGKYRPGQSVPEGTRFDVIPGHQEIYFNEHGYEVLARLDEEADRTGVPHIEQALSWVFRQPGVTSVLVGARQTSHLDQALAAMKSAVQAGDQTSRNSPESRGDDVSRS
ncbi:MAG: aldo/keto reductase [Fuerstiella sp.]